MNSKYNKSNEVTIGPKDLELEALIREQIDKYLNIYDDACRQISRHNGAERSYYIELAKESMTTVGDLLTQLPNVDKEIKIYSEKAQ